MYTMRLRSVGNPDFRQYAPISDPKTVTGTTLAEMRAHAQEYIQFWDLGGGNWTNPVVKLDGKVIGHFSYNGRLWEGKRYSAEDPEREINIEAGEVIRG